MACGLEALGRGLHVGYRGIVVVESWSWNRRTERIGRRGRQDALAREGGESLGRIAQKDRTHRQLINLLVWVIVGGIAGWLAGMVVQGTGLGVIGDVIVGIVGALIGGFVLSLLLPGTFGISGFNLGSLVVAFIGAVILLFVVKLFTGRRAVS